ncbi:MAG: dTMP kinase [Actinomycetota bacterium]
MKGKFITFEGPDGSGKTTQIKLAAGYLKKKGYGVLTAVEPGGTPIGEKIRRILLDKRNLDMTSRAETLLFLASRAQLAEKVIRPALEEKKIVICDRFFDSTVVYQGIARGLGADRMLDLSLWATGGLVPDMTFLLNVGAGRGAARKSMSGIAGDRLESQGGDFMQKVCRGYLEIAEKFKQRYVVIDGEKGIQEVFGIVRDKIDGLIG